MAEGLASLMQEGGKYADLLTDLESLPMDPDAQIKAFRGENLIKSLGQKLGSDEAAGRWYGFTAEKSQRYPFDKNPSILGGAVTRSMNVTPMEIIEGSRQAMYEHGKTMLARNLENDVPRAKAENIYYNYLNQVDDFHSDAMRKLQAGELPSDKFNFMLKTNMAEGVFDKTGDIDIAETFKRGNYGIAGLLAAKEAGSKVLPYLAKGLGIAMLPIDLVLGANQTGLDPEEELGAKLGIDPSVFYQMEPEKFQMYKDAYDSQVARAQAIQDAKNEEMMAVSP